MRTPAFDRVAREGVYVRNAFAASPGCSPSRAALLTGRHPWQIEQAGTHDSDFPLRYLVFPDLLERAGYHVGMTGKGWGPGNWANSGRKRNPAGPAYDRNKCKTPAKGISANDYASNFKDFLAERPKGRPFYFWYGGHEPHRPYERGAALKAGKKLEDAVVPPYLPDSPEVRSDLLDACFEVEWFDQHLASMLAQLEEIGELDNTFVIVTADNGMSFPRAKANAYEDGLHVPLALRWRARIPGGRQIDDVVGFVDLTATLLEAAGTPWPTDVPALSGRSLLSLLVSQKAGLVDSSRNGAYASRERHSSSRYNNWTYPQRALRTARYLYIRNFRPERWPAGDPVLLKANGESEGPHSGYKDIDGCPTLDYLIAHSGEPAVRRFFDLAVAKRPAEEFFDIQADPGCLVNLANDAASRSAKEAHARQLETHLRSTGDSRVLDGGEIWETYRRYSAIRKFPAPEQNK